jgi:hypothetical protein
MVSLPLNIHLRTVSKITEKTFIFVNIIDFRLKLC